MATTGQPFQPPRLALNVNTEEAPFPDALFDELSTAVKGPVLRPSDSKYPDRARTFNGKLKPSCRVLVSPLDATDVSAVIHFCRTYGLSPSVRAGGYGIAGWAVAGDVVVDMSMIRDIDIEPPVERAEGEGEAVPDWTPLKDMPAVGSKGKGRAQPPPPNLTLRLTAAAPSSPVGDVSTGKRRRDSEDVPDGLRADPTVLSTPAGRGPYDAASHAVASFLRGPPLPPIPGDIPREPPTNRPRLHSPEPSSPLLMDSSNVEHSSGANQDQDVDMPHQHSPPAPRQEARDLGESIGSSLSSAPPSFASNAADASSTSAGEAPDAFRYMSSNPMPLAFGQTVGSDGASLGVSAVSPLAMGRFMQPPPGASPSSGVMAWNPMMGFSSGAPGPGPSQFPFLPNSMAMPPAAPSLSAMGLGPSQMFPAMPGASAAYIPASESGNGPGGHLGTMHYARPVHPHAYVTFGAGMRQKEVDMYTADHPFVGVSPVTGEREEGAVPYHIPMSAHPVGSSIMLLAGFGFISRLYGLSIDNLVEVEMVLADGRIVIVNAENDPDLWWAVRGAGPAFGIATRYKVRAYPIPVVFAGNIIYRFHRATAPSLIKHFRDCIKDAPRELYANVLLTAGPADKDSLVVIQICYVGPKAKGVEYLQAISSWDGERCLLNEVNEKSFLNQQDSVAQVLRGKPGRQWFLRSALITSLTDEIINRTVLAFANTPIGCTWIFELAGGAIGDFEDNCLPKEQREAAWTVAALHQWDMGIDDPRCITSAEAVSFLIFDSSCMGIDVVVHQWMKTTISPMATGGPFPVFLGRHEDPGRTMACYGKNWSRLAELKRRYDPDCFFKNNFWPLDKDGNPIELLTNEPPSP
ncbi:hypothetical protein GSI_04313 [Ganoderma sinense ZZ0214-1]|uniref:FAD-binding PCMH-type domain-containing protein n=1 Tax=Ganoderma sinense ZZ0214-1 TaxID=1077348 RepID=A0A2G8SIU2_9APHY|nr:hypothetical protein GSI_04313 [Ganoderma sinense ZZ0214-1]